MQSAGLTGGSSTRARFCEPGAAASVPRPTRSTCSPSLVPAHAAPAQAQLPPGSSWSRRARCPALPEERRQGPRSPPCPGSPSTWRKCAPPCALLAQDQTLSRQSRPALPGRGPGHGGHPAWPPARARSGAARSPRSPAWRPCQRRSAARPAPGGRASVRTALYMAALTAAASTPCSKPSTNVRAAGKPFKPLIAGQALRAQAPSYKIHILPLALKHRCCRGCPEDQGPSPTHHPPRPHRAICSWVLSTRKARTFRSPLAVGSASTIHPLPCRNGVDRAPVVLGEVLRRRCTPLRMTEVFGSRAFPPATRNPQPATFRLPLRR